MLSLERVLPDWEAERLSPLSRRLHLFMSGRFRPFVEREGYLGWYLSEGARAYSHVGPSGFRLWGVGHVRVTRHVRLNDSFFLQSGKVLIGQSCQFLVNSIVIVADGN